MLQIHNPVPPMLRLKDACQSCQSYEEQGKDRFLKKSLRSNCYEKGDIYFEISRGKKPLNVSMCTKLKR